MIKLSTTHFRSIAFYSVSLVAALPVVHAHTGQTITDHTLDGTTHVEGPIYMDDTITDSSLGNPVTGQWNVTLENGLFIWGDAAASTPQTWSSGSPVLFWYPEKSAFRAGFDSYGAWSLNNLGLYSTAFGYNTTASGNYSAAFGHEAGALGDYSAAFGNMNTASGMYSAVFGVASSTTGSFSIASGMFSSASGLSSSAFGSMITAPNPYQTTLGVLNLNVAGSIFEIGNGDDSYYTQSNALTVLRNGQTTLTNAAWKDELTNDPLGTPQNAASSSEGEALVVEGHARFCGKVELEVAQGDISMGAYGVSN